MVRCITDPIHTWSILNVSIRRILISKELCFLWMYFTNELTVLHFCHFCEIRKSYKVHPFINPSHQDVNFCALSIPKHLYLVMNLSEPNIKSGLVDSATFFSSSFCRQGAKMWSFQILKKKFFFYIEVFI